MAEFVAYAKQRPGKLKYATPGAGSFPHYDMEILIRRAGIEMTAIHIKAGPTGYINDMVKGDIQVALMNVATSGPQIKAGTLRPLALIAEKRLPAYPDVPTIAEAGYPGVGTTLWTGLFAPAATPPDVLQTLQKAVTQSLKAPQVIEAYAKQNIRSRPTASLDEAKTWLQGEIAHWQKITNGSEDRSHGLARNGRVSRVFSKRLDPRQPRIARSRVDARRSITSAAREGRDERMTNDRPQGTARPLPWRLLVRKDVLAGLLFIAIGVFGLWASRDYPIGTALRMSMGYVPRLLCWVLLGLGSLVLVQGLRAAGEGAAFAEARYWRAIVFVPASLVVFASPWTASVW